MDPTLIIVPTACSGCCCLSFVLLVAVVLRRLLRKKPVPPPPEAETLAALIAAIQESIDNFFERDLTNAWQGTPEELRVLNRVGRAQLLGNQQEAVEAITEALDSASGGFKAELLNQRGAAHAALGKWEPAAEDFRSAHELEPRRPEHVAYLTEALARTGNANEAARYGRVYLSVGGKIADQLAFEELLTAAEQVPPKE